MQAANRIVTRLALIYVATSLLATVFLLIFTDFLTRLLFAESYVAASDITRIMILSIPPQALYMLYRNPIDAVSVTPYNLIILFITIVAMVISFSLCTTLTQFAWAYLGVSVIQGLCSFITWERMKK
jgi:O-antigen/teichoic acid export membrane protein